ncbi:MAG: hypothetical protein RL621_1627 [Bacteroidota bacterium]|jgi:hypothetical protein
MIYFLLEISMKIAICLYGKFTGKTNRGENQDFRKPYEYLSANILSNNCDIFFHGWDDDDAQSAELVNLLKPKKYILEKQKQFSTPYKQFEYTINGPWNSEACLFNIYSRSYSLKRSVSLVDDTYDLVLIARFDTLFYSKINFQIFSPDNFYVTHWNLLNQGWGLNDGWFITGYDNAKNFAKLFDRLKHYYKIDSDFLFFAKKHKLSENELTSGHLPWRYRLVELGLESNIYAYGLEYETWGLLRRFGIRTNPFGRPDVDIKTPIPIYSSQINHRMYFINYLKYKLQCLINYLS